MIIEKEWQNFKAFVYPHVPENTEQMRQLKACWFSSFLSALSCMHETSALDEMQAVQQLEAMHDEAQTFIKTHAEKEFKRQGLVFNKKETT